MERKNEPNPGWTATIVGVIASLRRRRKRPKAVSEQKREEKGLEEKVSVSGQPGDIGNKR